VFKAARRTLSLGPTEPIAKGDAPPTIAASDNEAVVSQQRSLSAFRRA
jgi:hypothetical protein